MEAQLKVDRTGHILPDSAGFPKVRIRMISNDGLGYDGIRLRSDPASGRKSVNEYRPYSAPFPIPYPIPRYIQSHSSMPQSL